MTRTPRAEMPPSRSAAPPASEPLSRFLFYWATPLVAWIAALDLTLQGIHSDLALTARQSLAHYYMPALGFIFIGSLPSLFERRPRHRTPHWLRRSALLGMTLAILAAAVGLRLWRVTEWPPPGIGFEEFQIGARAALGGDVYGNLLTIYGPPGEHALTAWATSLSFAALGTGFFALRLPFIVAGLLCPFLLFAVCRRVVAWEPALFAVALFAVSWWQVAASRAADEIFFPIWVELLLLWALIELEASGRAWAAFLVALTSGLLVYEYTSYHLVAPLILAYLLARVARFALRVARRPDPATRRTALIAAWRTYGAGAVTLLLVWLILAQFQLVSRATGARTFAGGAAQHAGDPDALIATLATPSELPAFVVRKLLIPVEAAILPGYGEDCRYLGTGAAALFDPATALVLGAALLVTALTPRRRLHLLALVWAGLVIAGAALLPQNANLHRYYTGLPVFFLLIALAADVLWQRARTDRARWSVLGVFAAVVAYAAWANVHHLHGLYSNPTFRDAWRWPRTEIIAWIRQQPTTDSFCVVTTPAAEIQEPTPLAPDYRWLTRDWNVAAVPSLDGCLSDPAAAHPTTHIIWALPETPADLGDRLRARYGEVREAAPIDVPNYRFTARVFTLPAAGTPAT